MRARGADSVDYRESSLSLRSVGSEGIADETPIFRTLRCGIDVRYFINASGLVVISPIERVTMDDATLLLSSDGDRRLKSDDWRLAKVRCFELARDPRVRP